MTGRASKRWICLPWPEPSRAGCELSKVCPPDPGRGSRRCEFLAIQEGRMDIDKNARSKPHLRADPARRVLDQGQSPRTRARHHPRSSTLSNSDPPSRNDARPIRPFASGRPRRNVQGQPTTMPASPIPINGGQACVTWRSRRRANPSTPRVRRRPREYCGFRLRLPHQCFENVQPALELRWIRPGLRARRLHDRTV
jgi:hypothetical protein